MVEFVVGLTGACVVTTAFVGTRAAESCLEYAERARAACAISRASSTKSRASPSASGVAYVSEVIGGGMMGSVVVVRIEAWSTSKRFLTSPKNDATPTKQRSCTYTSSAALTACVVTCCVTLTGDGSIRGEGWGRGEGEGEGDGEGEDGADSRGCCVRCARSARQVASMVSNLRTKSLTLEVRPAALF